MPKNTSLDKTSQEFIKYLESAGISTNSLKFYKSDLNHFTGWFLLRIRSLGILADELTQAIPFLKSSHSQEYKQYLLENKEPIKTINRRLSTLRNLSRFLTQSQIINFNFMEGLTNITVAGEERLQIHPLVEGFQKHLEAEKVSASTIKNYLADIRQFISPGLPKITPELLKAYLGEISKGPSQATAKRKIASLKKFVAWAQKQGLVKNISLFGKNIFKKAFYASLQDKIIKRLEQKPGIQKIAHSLFYKRPEWYRTYHDISITNYIHIAILVIFSTALGFGAYNQFFKGTSTPLAYPTSLVPPNRFLSFQGRLTDNLGNPITVSTNLVFKLYDAATAGNTLWNAAAAACAITPDSDGIFSTILGSTCGGAIAATVFSENPNVWVGVKVASDNEATPRIQIATVGYALNAETLQGFPIDATGSATKNTVVTMNNGGEIIIAESGPKIRSVSGTFAIVGQAMTLQTPDTSDGAITINPDGTGALNLTFEGAAAGGAVNGFLNATNANITSGALYGGTVASAATGYNFIDFKSGVSPTSKFSVSSTGQITTASGLTIGTTSLNETTAANDSGAYIVGVFDEFDNSASTNVQAVLNDLDAAVTSGGSGSMWTLASGVIYPTSAANDFAIGGTTLAASMFGIDESAGNFYFGYDNSANPTFNFEATDADAGEFGFNTNDAFYFSNANVGIGNTTPTSRLDIVGSQNFSAFTAPGALTAGTPTTGGACTAGTHSYKVTFTSVGSGETTGGTTSNQITCVLTTGQTVPLTGIPTGPAGTISRKIYRTVAGDTGSYLLLTTISDNTTTTYSDTTADGSLGAAAPTLNTTAVANLQTGGTTRMVIDNSGSVGIGTTSPAATALLDLTSTTKGFLAPRMTTDQRDAIVTPATGLFIYNTTTNQYNVFNGATWGAVGGGGGAWSDLTVPTANLSLAHGVNATTFGWTPTGALDAWTMNLVNNGASATSQNALVVNNAVAGAFTDVNTENLILVQQLDTTAAGTTLVDNGIKIDSAASSGMTNGLTITNSAGNLTTGINIADTAGGTLTTGINFSGTFTKEISLSNAETIDNVTDGTINLGTTTLKLTGGTTLVSDQLTVALLNTTTTSLSLGGAATTLNLGTTDGVTRAINIGTGTGADTINIGTGATTANTINIGTDAIANAITIGTTTASSALALNDDNWNITGAGLANFVSIGAATAGSGAFTTLTATPGSNVTALTLTGTNVSSANLAYFNSKNTSGTIFNTAYGAAASLAGALTGINLDLSTNLTAAGYGVTGQAITLPAVTNTGVGTYAYKGLTVTGGALVQNTGAGTDTWTGLDVTMPNITQTTGAVTSTGLKITGGTVTSGTSYGLIVDANAGNVGIGTTGPTETLDVAGDIRSTTGSLQIGNSANLAYSRLGTAATGHAANLTTSDDLLLSGDLELNGVLYLDGAIITNSAGTSAITLSSTPTTTANSLSASNWLIENTANLGQAALMVNQTLGGDIFTASVSGAPKFVISNLGRVGIGTTTPSQALDVTGTITSSTGNYTSQVANGASAVGFTLNTTTALSTQGAKLLSVQNFSAEKFYIDKDGNLYTSGTILSGNGQGFLVTNKSGGTVANRSLIILDTTTNSSFTTTTTAYNKAAYGIITGVGLGVTNDADGDGVCDANDICMVAVGGEVEVLLTNALTTVKGDYVYTTSTAGSGVASAKQFDGLIGVVSNTAGSGSGYVKIIFKPQPQVSGSPFLEKADTSLADGSYVEIVHNTNFANVVASGWYWDGTNWSQVDITANELATSSTTVNFNTEANYSQENMAYSITLTPSATSGDITLTLGSGTWNSDARVKAGCRVTGNGGVANITGTPAAQTTITATTTTNFTNTNAIASGSWYLYCTTFDGSVVKLNTYQATTYVSDVGTFATTSQGQLPTTNYYHSTVTATIGGTQYLYVTGGYGAAVLSTVYKATIDSSGNAGAFATTSQGQLPTPLDNHSTVTATIGGTQYLYVTGGGYNVGTVSTVYKATIDASGNVGTFATTSQGQLPQIIRFHSTVTASIGGTQYLYVTGGYDATRISTIYKATIDASGNVGTFATTSQAQLPQILYLLSTVTASIGGTQYLYVTGGNNGSGTSTVYKATINASGNVGAFATTSQGQLPQNINSHSTVTATIGGTQYLYVTGGWGTAALSTVYKAAIDSSGNVGAFATLSQGQLPINIEAPSTVTASIGGTQYLYVTGGVGLSTVYKATIGPDSTTTSAPTSTYYTTVTNGDQISTSAWQNISSVAVTETLNSQTAYYAVSFDARTTFYKYDSTTADNGWRPIARNYNSGTWQYNSNVTAGVSNVTWTSATYNSQNGAISQAVGVTANQMTGTQLAAVTELQWRETNGYTPTTATLDFAVALYTTSASQIPQVDQIKVNYTKAGFKIVQTDTNTVRMYNYTGSAKNVKLNVIPPGGGGSPGAGAGLFTNNSSSVTDGSYVEVAHNQNTSDFVSNGWKYNTATSKWEAVDVTANELATYSNTVNFNTEASYSQENMAYSVTLTPSAISGDITLTLGSGTWNSDARVKAGCRVTGNGGVANITGTPAAQTTITATTTTNFTNTNAIASGSWYLYCTTFDGSVVKLNSYQSTVYQSDVGAFATTSQGQLPTTNYQHNTVTATIGGTQYLYVTGGYSAAAFSTVYKAAIDSSGNVGVFATTSQGQLPTTNYYHSTVTATIGGTQYLYVTGGVGFSTVYKAQIDTSGNVGAFATTSQGQLPTINYVHSTVTATIGGTQYLYVTGGYNGATRISTIYKATIDASGNVGAFATTSQGQLPQINYYHSTVTATIGGTQYLYVTGGNSGTVLSTVYKATIDASGNVGAFATTSQGQLPQIIQQLSTVTAAIGGTQYLYVTGGYTGAATISTVYKAAIDSSGNVGAFATTSQGQLPQIIQQLSTVTAAIGGTQYLYVTGGYSAAAVSTVYKATIGPDTLTTAVPTSTYYTTVTNGDQISTSSWQNISSVAVTETLNSQTAYYGVSFDARTTFYKYDSTTSNNGWRGVARNNSGTWQYNSNVTAGVSNVTWTSATYNSQNGAISQAVGVTANQMTGTQLAAVTESQWRETNGYTPTTATLDFAVALYTNSATQIPQVDQIKVNYTKAGYKVIQTDANTARLYNYSGLTQNLRLDVITGGLGRNAGTVSLAPAAADVDSQTSTNSIWLNKTGSGGNLLKLQTSGSDMHLVNNLGDITGGITTLDGSTTANGAGTSSTTLILTSATNFDIGNYVKISSTDCVTGVNVCYAKITAISTNTLTISPALSWANASTVVEVHVPELGGIDTSQALANRYGRGYFIDGVVAGNGSTYFTDNLISFGGGSKIQDSSGKLQLQAGGTGTGSTGTGSIYFLDSGGTTRARLDTTTPVGTSTATVPYTTEANYSQENMAYAVTLTPSATSGSITLTLGSGTWNADARVKAGCRVAGNGGVATITGTPAAQTTIAATTTTNFTNTNAIASGSWYLYCTTFDGSVVKLNTYQAFAYVSDVGAFATTSQGQLPQNINSHSTVTASIGGTQYLYVTGGQGAASLSTVYKATIDASGNVSAFATTSQGQLPQIMIGPSTVTATIGGTQYLYVTGGADAAYLSTVYKATINSSGNVGAFATTSQGQLPQGFYYHSTVTATIGGTQYLYVTGGTFGATKLSTVYKATIDSSGNVGAFATTSQGQLPVGNYGLSTVTATIGGTQYLYVTGGFSGVTLSTVYKATIDASGNVGTFSTTSQGQLPQIIDYLSTVTASIGGTQYLYVTGGYTGTASISTIYKATIDASGNVGAFATTSQGQLPQVTRQHSTVTATIGGTQYLYVTGGYSAANLSTVYKATIGPDTTTTAAPTSTYYTTVTNGDQISTSFWYDVDSGTVTETLNSQTAYYSFSFDGRTTFNVYDGSSGAWRSIAQNNAGTWQYNSNATYGSTTWTNSTTNAMNAAISQAMGVAANRMTGTVVNAVTGTQWQLSGGFVQATTTTIDTAVSLYTTSADQIPQTDLISFGYTTDYTTLYVGATNTSSADLAEMFVSGDPTIGAGDVVVISDSTVRGVPPEGGPPSEEEIIKTQGVLRKATIAYDPKLLGIISTSPGFLMNSIDGDTGKEDKRMLAISGHVPVKIAPDSPAIEIGDFLTSSATYPGMAMKATEAGYTVGKALEAWTPSEISNYSNCSNCSNDTIEVFVNLGYSDPDLAFTDTGDLKIVSIQITQNENMNSTEASSSADMATPSATLAYRIIKESTQEVIDRIGAFAEVVAANIKAGAIATKELTTNSFTAFQGTIDNLLITNGLVSPIVQTNLISPLADSTDVVIRLGKSATPEESKATSWESSSSGFGKLIIQNPEGEEVASIDEGGNATFSGTIVSDQLSVNNDATVSGTLYADSIKSQSLEDIENLLRKVEADQDLLAQAKTWNTNTASDSADLAMANGQWLMANIENLFVTGQAAVDSLSVSNSFAVGSDLIIQPSSIEYPVSSINTLTSPLSLQSLAMAPVEIMAGKIRIDTNGNMIITGNLNIAGDLEVTGKTKLKEVELEKLIIAQSPTSQESSSSATFEVKNGEIQTNATAGKATIPAGVSEITINNPNISDYTLIYVTPTSTTNNNVLFVKSKQVGKFTVGFTNPLDVDVTFNWWVIEVSR